MAVYEPVRALERGLSVLEAVNIKDGMKTQEVADRCKLSRPTAYRLLETLQHLGFVEQSPSDGAWHPALRCNVLSSGFLDKAWISQVAMPEMIRLGAEILWPVDLVTFHEDAMLVRESTHKISPFSFDVGMVGTKLPMLLTAGGRAYLAFCPEDERAQILEIMRNSDKPEHMMAQEPRYIDEIIRQTLDRGYGFRAEEFKANTVSISMPIRKDGRPIAALTIISLKSAISLEEQARKFATRLRATCDIIESKVADLSV